MRNWNGTCLARLLAAEGAAKLVSSGDRVHSHMGAARPLALLDALCQRAAELRGEVLHCITIGEGSILKAHQKPCLHPIRKC